MGEKGDRRAEDKHLQWERFKIQKDVKKLHIHHRTKRGHINRDLQLLTDHHIYLMWYRLNAVKPEQTEKS